MPTKQTPAKIGPELLSLAAQHTKPRRSQKRIAYAGYSLTPGNWEAWKLIAEGRSDKEMAEVMGLTMWGVRYHLRCLLKATGLSIRWHLSVLYPHRSA